MVTTANMSQTVFHIGVNAYEANVPHRVGSNQYAYKLLVELEKQTRGNENIVWTIYLSRPPLTDMPQARAGWQYRVVQPSLMWTQWRLPIDLYFGKLKQDVFLSLGHYAPRFCPFPSVVCVLDLAYLKFPQFFRKRDLYQLEKWTEYSVKAAKRVFTISENSKADIQSHYHKAASDIDIIYPGIESVTEKLSQAINPEVLHQYGLKSGRYIVSVGTIQPRKNMISVMHAFEALKATGQYADLKLVFVGKPGWLTQEFDDALNASPNRADMVVTGFVDEATKYGLLKQAACSVLVGYYEGFGIPAVESLLYGITPVVANTASLPEVVGEYGVLVDPYSQDDIARGLAQAIAKQPDTLKRRQMQEWAQQFSWETSATKMLEVLRDKFAPTNS